MPRLDRERIGRFIVLQETYKQKPPGDAVWGRSIVLTARCARRFYAGTSRCPGCQQDMFQKLAQRNLLSPNVYEYALPISLPLICFLFADAVSQMCRARGD